MSRISAFSSRAVPTSHFRLSGISGKKRLEVPGAPRFSMRSVSEMLSSTGTKHAVDTVHTVFWANIEHLREMTPASPGFECNGDLTTTAARCSPPPPTALRRMMNGFS